MYGRATVQVRVVSVGVRVRASVDDRPLQPLRRPQGSSRCACIVCTVVHVVEVR